MYLVWSIHNNRFVSYPGVMRRSVISFHIFRQLGSPANIHKYLLELLLSVHNCIPPIQFEYIIIGIKPKEERDFQTSRPATVSGIFARPTARRIYSAMYIPFISGIQYTDTTVRRKLVSSRNPGHSPFETMIVTGYLLTNVPYTGTHQDDRSYYGLPLWKAVRLYYR